MRKPLILTLLLSVCWMQTQTAQATFHFWKIDQVYSNATGSVQYIDLVLPFAFDDESHVGGHPISAGLNSNSFVLPNNLPAEPVVGQHFLIATPGFASIAGIEPDYTLPVAPFFNPAGDTVDWAGVNSLTFPALPTDGILAYSQDGSLVVNAPTNFAGAVGFVPEPSAGVLAMIAAAALWTASRMGGRRA